MQTCEDQRIVKDYNIHELWNNFLLIFNKLCQDLTGTKFRLNSLHESSWLWKDIHNGAHRDYCHGTTSIQTRMSHEKFGNRINSSAWKKHTRRQARTVPACAHPGTPPLPRARMPAKVNHRPLRRGERLAEIRSWSWVSWGSFGRTASGQLQSNPSQKYAFVWCTHSNSVLKWKATKHARNVI